MKQIIAAVAAIAVDTKAAHTHYCEIMQHNIIINLINYDKSGALECLYAAYYGMCQLYRYLKCEHPEQPLEEFSAAGCTVLELCKRRF